MQMQICSQNQNLTLKMIFKIEKENAYKSGIYKILNTRNGNFYIGSAYKLYNRFRVHKSTLKNNKHDNEYLQRAYNKYGSDSFVFELVKLIDITELHYAEQQYLNDLYDNNIKCYNLNRSTKPEQLLIEINRSKQIEFELVDPDGKLHKFKSFIDAAIKVSIPDTKPHVVASAFGRLISRKLRSYKGWRIPEEVGYDYKNYRKIKGKGALVHEVKLLSPDLKVYENIFNMKKFAIEHGVEPSILFNIVARRTRYSNGWSLFTGEYKHPIAKNAKTFTANLKSPDGIVYKEIDNLTKFCREHSINVTSIRKLIKGKIKNGQYRGWTTE